MNIVWKIEQRSTGKLIKEGVASASSANRLGAPGFNNHVFYKVKKGETVVVECEASDIKATYSPGVKRDV